MKLLVKNLAKIKQAEIDIQPLTIFFGKNNTNKSLLAHVIYGVYDGIPMIEFLTLNNILKKNRLNIENIKRELERVDIHNKEFKKSLRKFILNIFKEKNFSQKFNIEIYNYTEHKHRIEEYKKLIENRGLIALHSFISRVLDNITYFPASRTGFMLSLDDLIAGLMEKRFDVEYIEQKPHSMLTQPVVDFLIKIHKLKSYRRPDNETKDQNITQALEILSKIIQGEIIKEDQTRQFRYKPKDLKKIIPFHLVSSSVIELAPLYIVLDSYKTLKDKIFIIEEPESHLHPINQIRMAEFIVFLVNSGMKVIITTHSDYILSSLNLCLKRFWAGENKEKDKYIQPQDIAVYLFTDEKNKIDIKPLEITKPEGISFENFYSAADYLDEEMDRLDKILYGD